MRVRLLTVGNILEINKTITQLVKQKSVCIDQNKVESALGAAFYPGNYPFQYGGIARVAGALCFFLIKAHGFLDANKRTAVIASTLFMDINGWSLKYPLNANIKTTALTDVVEKTASSQMSKDELIEWYDGHKELI